MQQNFSWQCILTIGKVSASPQLVIIVPPLQRDQIKQCKYTTKTLVHFLDRVLGQVVAHRPEKNVTNQFTET